MNKKHIGLILKDLRSKYKLTQEEFALKIGLTRANYSQIERGVSAPTLKTISFIINEFKIDANVFFNSELTLENTSDKQTFKIKVVPNEITNATENEHLHKYISALESQLKDKERIIELLSKK